MTETLCAYHFGSRFGNFVSGQLLEKKLLGGNSFGFVVDIIITDEKCSLCSGSIIGDIILEVTLSIKDEEN